MRQSRPRHGRLDARGIAALLVISCAPSCWAAGPTGSGVERVADTPFFRIPAPDWWTAIQHSAEEHEAQRLRDLLAPEQWIAVPIAHGAAREGAH